MFLSLFFVQSNADENLINSVCSKADDVKYCLDLFHGDSRSSTADVHGLALIAIQTAIHKSQDTLNSRIPDLQKNITDPVGKQRLGVCQSDYNNAITKFSSAFESTSGNAYSDTIDWVRKGVDDVVDCQNIYRKNDIIAESPISAENHEISINISAVILTVIDILTGNRVIFG